jgi:hypothetical protein
MPSPKDDGTDPRHRQLGHEQSLLSDRLGLEAWSAREWRPFLFQPEDVATVSAMDITELSVPR